eukprot:scaffold2120_cov59-Phaeocystis_antarctica.AAC.1
MENASSISKPPIFILPPVQATLSGCGRVRLTVPERNTSGAFGGVSDFPVDRRSLPAWCAFPRWLTRFWHRSR